MKRLSALLFSLLFLYVAVASVLESCLRLPDHFDHSASVTNKPHPGGSLLSKDFDSLEHHDADLHCSHPHYQVGPAISMARADSFADGVVSNESASSELPASSKTGVLGLRDIFRKFRSPPYSLSLHLFFSVLRI